LIVREDCEPLARLAATLRSRGDDCVRVRSYDEALHHIERGAGPVRVVLHPGNPAFGELATVGEAAVASLVLDDLVALKRLFTEIARSQPEATLWGYSDHAAWRAEGPLDRRAVLESPTFGFLKSMRLERHALVRGIVTSDPDLGGEDLLRHLAVAEGSVALTIREGVAYEPYLAPSADAGRQEPFRLRADATYLVTGGTGGIGRQIVRWLHACGAKHVVVASRGGGPVAPWEDARVTDYTADAASEADVINLAAKLAAGHPPLAGIFHAAGVNELASLEEQTDARFREVAAAKILGSLLLRRHLAPRDFFVGIGSIAGAWGAAKMQAYCAASSFQSQLARSDLFACAQHCVSYGPWSKTGMVDEAVGQHLQRQGLSPISIDEGLRGLELALGGRVPHVIDVAADWARYAAIFGTKVAARFFDRVVPAASVPAVPRETGSATLTLASVRDLAATILGHPPAKVDVEAPLHALGMDSILALDFQKALEARAGVSLPRTLIFDYPTIAEIHRHIESSRPPPPRPSQADAVAPSTEIAIIGVALRAPGAANVDALWDLLEAQKDAVRRNVGAELAARAGVGLAELPQCPAYHAGLIDGVDRFDAERFNVSPREAELMDPQQRIAMELAWHTFEHAGYSPVELRRANCGVFVGTGNFEYREICRRHAVKDGVGMLATSHVPSVIPGRIAYFFDLKGPSIAIDTACSSSLVAIHQACLSLRSGDCSMALAGGVNLILAHDNHLTLHESNMLSVSGVCSAFDAAANGYVRSEAAGFVLLKPLDRAVADGDRVLAVIRGSAVNQDGRSSSLTAPNGGSQQEVMRTALRAARMAPSEIDVVEAHGTGTPLGDPIELQAIDGVYGERGDADAKVYATAVKANVGHAEAASGIVSIAKVLGVLARRRLPAQIHYTEPNPNTRVTSDSRVCVPRDAVTFEGDRPIRIAVSSFGFSGTNAHLILESAPTQVSTPDGRDAPAIFVLSASTEAGLADLRRQYRRYCDALDERAVRDLMARLSRHAGLGVWRTAGVFRDRVDLLDLLQTAPTVAIEGPARDVRLARPKRPPSGFLAKLEGALRAARVAYAWSDAEADVQLAGDVDHDVASSVAAAHRLGQGVDLEAIPMAHRAPRVRLPSYPFERQRHWIFEAPAVGDRQHVGDLHQIRWVEDSSETENLPGRREGVVVLVTNHGALVGPVAALARAAPLQLLIVLVGESDGATLDGVVAAESVTCGVRDALDSLRARSRDVNRFVFAWKDQNEDDGALALFELLQSLAQRRLFASPVRIVTHHAQCVDGAELRFEPTAAMLWGIANVARAEFPELPIACVDLDDDSPASVAREVLADPLARHAAWRTGKLYVPQLEPMPSEPAARASLPIAADATYVIAGGLGGIGFEVLRWILEHGARHVVLLGRRGPGERQACALRELRARHQARVEVVSVDITNVADVRACLLELRSEMPPIRGVIQAAGVVEDGLIVNLSRDRFRAPIAAKTRGTIHLHDATRDAPLDFFVCFSSTTALLGNIGQAAYAAANAFLDCLVHRMRREGVAAQSIAWGPWGEVGVAAAAPEGHYEAHGIAPLSTRDGLSRLAAVLRGAWPHTVAIRVDWSKFGERRGDSSSYVLPGHHARRPVKSYCTHEEIHAGTRGIVADVLKLGASGFSETKDFHLMGVDSVMAVQLRNRLCEAFGHSFRSTLIFDYPNVAALSRYIANVKAPTKLDCSSGTVADKLAQELDEIAVLLSE
jgi:acyl transferase domain-containing protein/acyl carrier protein